MPRLSHKHEDVTSDARMLTEKLKRYRKARALNPNILQECKLENNDANRDARVLTEQQAPDSEAGTLVEKLERYREARELKLSMQQECFHANSDADRDARVLTEQQAPDSEADTLVDKLERYREARARKLDEEKQGRKSRSKDAYREAAIIGPDTLDTLFQGLE